MVVVKLEAKLVVILVLMTELEVIVAELAETVDAAEVGAAVVAAAVEEQAPLMSKGP